MGLTMSSKHHEKKIQSATHLMSHVGWWTTDQQARQNIQFKKRKKEKKTK